MGPQASRCQNRQVRTAPRALALVATWAALSSCTSGSTHTSSRSSAASLPIGPVYPAPISRGEGDVRSGCPSLSGVETSAQPSLNELAQAIHDLGGSRAEALRATDPAFWPMIVTNKFGSYYGRGSPSITQLVSRLVATRTSQSGYEDLVLHCGSATVASTWIVQLCEVPHGQTAAQGCAADPALAEKFVFLDRLGHWLIVYEN